MSANLTFWSEFSTLSLLLLDARRGDVKIEDMSVDSQGRREMVMVKERDGRLL